MYSNRSPPTVPTGMELPYISIPGTCGIAPSTGINLFRKYSSILGSVYALAITEFYRYGTLVPQSSGVHLRYWTACDNSYTERRVLGLFPENQRATESSFVDERMRVWILVDASQLETRRSARHPKRLPDLLSSRNLSFQQPWCLLMRSDRVL